MKLKTKIQLLLNKWLNYEFWPIWLLYAPMFLYGIILAIRARSFTYFTATNPGMKYGGAFALPKMDILNILASQHRPRCILISKNTLITDIIGKLKNSKLVFPLVAKPNIGERGKDVEKINSPKELENYFQNQKYDTIIQEYIDYPMELGIFYYRYPDGTKDGITSIVKKEFLSITGNGKSTIKELLSRNMRACYRMKYLKRKYSDCWNTILPSGLTMKIEPIGNHNRGTKFLNANQLINGQLLRIFREISAPLDGFYYGRYDIKVTNLNDLYEGKNIKILELNGVNSEPAHIYDPNHSIWAAYRSIIKHMHIVFHISQQNRKNGVIPSPLFPLLKTMYFHVFPKRNSFHNQVKATKGIKYQKH